MSFLDDLAALDLTRIVDAKVAITGSVAGLDDLLRVDASISVFGDLGTSLAGLGDLSAIAGDIGGPAIEQLQATVVRLRSLDLPLDAYRSALEDAARLVLGALPDFRDDPLGLRTFTGRSLDELLGEAARGAAARVAGVAASLADVRAVIDILDGELPTDPEVIVRTLLDALTPYGAGALLDVGEAVRAVVGPIDALNVGGAIVPPTRATGLVAQLDAITAMAATASVDELQAAITELGAQLSRTRAQLEVDLGGIGVVLDALPLSRLTTALDAVDLADGLSPGPLDVLGLLAREVAAMRGSIATLDVSELGTLAAQGVELLERGMRATLVERLDAGIDIAVRAVEDLLADNPVRDLRDQLTELLLDVAIEVGELADPATALRDRLSSVAGVELPDVAPTVQGKVAEIRQTLGSALDGISAAIADVRSAVDAVAAEAAGVIEPVVGAIGEFASVVGGLGDLVDGLDLSGALDEVVGAVREIRLAVAEPLAEVPLPEPVRPLVDQLIASLEDIVAVDAMSLEPVAAIMSTITGALDSVTAISADLVRLDDVLANVLPTRLIAEIDSEVGGALAKIAGFDPATLTAGVTSALASAQASVGALQIADLLSPIGRAFDELVSIVDTLDPHRFLAPAIEAFDAIKKTIALPDPTAAAAQVSGAVAATTAVAGQAVAGPLRQVLPAGGGGATEAAGQPDPPVRVGDAVRVVGWVPSRLRAAIEDLGAGPAGEVLRIVQRTTKGLADALRAVAPALHGLDASIAQDLGVALAPVRDAQLRAQVAIAARADAGALHASLDVVALAGAAPIEAQLGVAIGTSRARVTAAVDGLGAVALAADRLASQLDAQPLTAATTGVDALLAALDVEPLAAELDALAATVLSRMGDVVAAIRPTIEVTMARFTAVFDELHPLTQAQKLRRIIDAVLRELDLIDPRRFADELGIVHGALRSAIAAYDPVAMASELQPLLDGLTAQVAALATLDPATVLGDLSELDAVVSAAAALRPAELLDGIGAPIVAVGSALGDIDLGRITGALGGLVDDVTAEVERAFDAVLGEVVELLRSIEFAMASARVEVSVGAST
jgi:hypothetical protein